MHNKPSPTLPILADVDVLIIGGTSHGVALAHDVKAQGLSVMLAAPYSYLGEDICAAMRFWPERDKRPTTALFADLFPGDSLTPPTPYHVKTTLEQSLVREEIPFYLQTRTGALLTDNNGHVGGVVLANRSGFQIIHARLVVDATLHGNACNHLLPERVTSLKGIQRFEHVILLEGAPQTKAKTAGSKELEPFTNGLGAKIKQISALSLEVEADCGEGTPDALNRAISQIQTACHRPGIFRQQSHLTPCSTSLPEKSVTHLSPFILKPGLISMSERVTLEEQLHVHFSKPECAHKIVNALGKQTADYARICKTHELKIQLANSEALPGGELSSNQALWTEHTTHATNYTLPTALPVLAEYDVLVAGGGTGGAPAAISAARHGAKTAVIETASALGGVGTIGQISIYWCGNRVGFSSEIDQGVSDMESQKRYKKPGKLWNATTKAAWLLQSCHDSGVSIWLNSCLVGTWQQDGRVAGLIVASPFGFGLIKAASIVDATGAADVAASAGAPTKTISHDHLAVQGTGLAAIVPGKSYNNSDHNFCDETSLIDTTAFLVSSRLKFAGAFDMGELIDTRERRKILGEVEIGPADILAERRFPDTVCVCSSNFDSHGFTIHPIFMIKPADKSIQLWADLPLRAMLPRNIEGVLVTGLALSAHRDALPVIRMQADVQNQGYAAGLAACMSALQGVPLRELDIRMLQKRLIEAGNLPARVLSDSDTFPVSDEALREVVDNGWDELNGLALIFEEPNRSLPLLRQAFAETDQPEKKLRLAVILGLLEDACAEAELTNYLNQADWDKGWNFRGMDQFGMTLSTVDVSLIALGISGDFTAWTPLLDKVNTLNAESEFSHIRAVATACESLYRRHPNPASSEALFKSLHIPGMTGHAQTSIQLAQSKANDDPNDNSVRNDSLKEIHMARALYRCGDKEGLGEGILRQYVQDVRGHFARHANAILTQEARESSATAIAS